jgi:amino acid adenylation domain-containing protein
MNNMNKKKHSDKNQPFIISNDLSNKFSVDKCVHRLFEDQTNRSPDATAVVCNNQNITYTELNQKANQVAHYLIALGVGPEVLVGICMDRSIDLIIGILAVLKAGGAYLPIDLSYPRERLIFMMEDAKATLLISEKQYSDMIPSSSARIICLDEFVYDNTNKENPRTDVKPDNLAYVIFTSGSTGKPNGVMVSHYNVVRLFNATDRWFNFNDTDIWTLFHTYAFDFSVWEMWGALLYGGKLVVIPHILSRSPENFYDVLVSEKVTVLNQTPSAFNQLIQAEEVKEHSHQLSLRYVIFGGEALKLSSLKPWFDRHGDVTPQLVNMYGITETTVHVTYRPVCSRDLGLGSVIGQPLPDLQLYVLDKELNTVPMNEPGELFVGGSGLSRGYLNRPELTKARFIVNPFSNKAGDRLYKTGDLARIIEGHDIEYLGRIDHQIKIRGFRIELGEIENKIREYPAIKDCCVTVREYAESVVRIIAYLVAREGLSIEQLKDHLKKYLPEYMVPNLFVILDKLPLTPNGKIDREALPVPDQIAHKHLMMDVHPVYDEVEKELVKIWKDLLGIEDVGLNDNFFDLGGNSLLMGSLQIRVNRALENQISIVDLFQYPSISSLAKHISKKRDLTSTADTKEPVRENTPGRDVAIIGMAGRYPGAKNIGEFWNNLCNGIESISFFSDDELELLPKESQSGELEFVKARGVLDNIDMFDAEFFGFTRREAELMDPQHRVFLECAWEALDDAGYSKEKHDGSIGIFAGSSLNTYLMYHVLSNRQALEEMMNSYQISEYTTLTGNDNAFLTTKAAYKLGLNGPAINIQTACSTSLVAIAQAYQSLISGQCDMALAGGVSITFPQKRGYFFVDGSIGSADGHCRAFDADATGTVFGSGAGIVVLKRLEDAKRDGDSIYAVIKSCAVNNDGADKAGYMAPSIDGQASVIIKAQELAGIKADSLIYVETHGTGTPVGDPIEIAGLEKAFRKSTSAKQFCGIGSVKTNIGHTDVAAGVTGFIKTALALKNRLLPASLHFHKPNPRIDFANSPFFVVNQLTNLNDEKYPLRAGVSAFGVGGTNAHVILEEDTSENSDSEEIGKKHLLVVSAKTENSLKTYLNELKEFLKNKPEESIADIAFTLQRGRREFEWRQFVVAESPYDASVKLERALDSGGNRGRIKSAEKVQLVFMFPGQGAQYVNMGRGLYESDSFFKDTIDRCAEILRPHLGLDIKELLFPPKNDELSAKKLEQTVYAQPALFILEYALSQSLIKYGIRPGSMIGHSVGEYVAACLSGVFTLEDVLYILSMRARLMQGQAPGSMLSARLKENEAIKYLCDNIDLAAINSPNLVVFSGETNKVHGLSEKLSQNNIENRILHTSHAYHSFMMDPVLQPFIKEFDKIKLNNPSEPFISSLTGTWITGEQAIDPKYWAAQLRSPVRFSSGVQRLQEKGHIVFVEIGPGRTLSTLVSQHRNENIKQAVVPTLAIPDENNDDVSNMLNALGRLWAEGTKIEWKEIYREEKRKRVHLPPYQFDRKKYWIEPPINKRREEERRVEAQNKAAIEQTAEKSPDKIGQKMTMSRKEHIIIGLKKILEELSGINKDDLEETKNFLELGFDSLFMTQVSLEFQKRFEVKITLRQLLESAPSILSIAEFIDSKLPEGKFEPPKQEISLREHENQKAEEIGESRETELSTPENNESSQGNALEKLVFEQLEIMRRQLEIFRAKGRKIETDPRNETGNVSLDSQASAGSPSSLPQVKVKKEADKDFERFGPYKPIDKAAGEGLTQKQQECLDKLIVRYNKKTPGSKELTQEHRRHYSDPRTVAGFSPLWKEMTYPIISKRSAGSKLWDVDDNEYVDVTMGFGQYLFGHNPKFVRDAIQDQMKKGFEIGPQSPLAGKVAKLICEFTGMDRASFCVTGSEAVLGAIRAARTVTGKDKVVMFAGDYHGINDEVLAKGRGIGDQRKSLPIAPGIPKEMVQNMIVLDYGEDESLKIIQKILPDLAAIIVEPVQARHPELQPKEFLQSVRRLTAEANVAFIFDEVVTGFRVLPGGAQEWFGIKADIATYGKIIGGGLPIGVIAGRSIYMDAFDGGMWNYGDASIPEAGVTFFAGTFARHPLTIAASYAVLNYLKERGNGLQIELNKKTQQLAEEINKFLVERNIPIRITYFSSFFYWSYPKDLKYLSLLFFFLRNRGLHIWEGRPCFLSEAHSDKDIEFIIKVFKESIVDMQDGGLFPPPLISSFKTSPHDLEINMEKYRLSEAQQEIWLASKLSEKASCSFNESSNLELKGRLDALALERSFNKVIRRHDALRTIISSDGKSQVVKNNQPFILKINDISTLSEPEKLKIVDERLGRETLKAFDLEQGPLIRGELFKLSEDNHRLILTTHHIVCDGWSYDVMVRDLSRLYTEEVEHKAEETSSPMQMREYVAYQEKFAAGEEYKKQEEYWLEKIKLPVKYLELPSDKERPSTRTFNGSRIARNMPPNLYSKVKEMGIKTGNTLFVSLLSAYALLLYKLTNQDDIIIGIPAAGQQVVGAHDLIGHCTNLLPIRISINPDMPFKEFLKENKFLVLDAYDNQQVTYGEIVRKLKIGRDPRRPPLISNMFNIDPAIMGLKFDDLECVLKVNPRTAYQFDFGFNIVASEKECEIECDFNTDIFSDKIVARYITYYNNIIELIVFENTTLLKDVQILSSSEISEIMAALSNSPPSKSKTP